MQNRIFGCIRPQVRSAALTWRPELPCVDPSVPQAIPVVCVRRTSISVQVLPFGLSLSPRVFKSKSLQVSRHAVVYTDASAKGWGATFNGLAVSGVWMGPQLHWHINCLELLAVHLAWTVWRDAYEASTYWSVRTALQPLRTSTDKVVYAPVACRNSPATSSSGVRSIWGRFAPFIFRACSNRQPTSCHELRSPESGDSIPRRSSWFATFWTGCWGWVGAGCDVPRDVTLPVVLLPAQRNTRHGRTGTVSMHFPQWAFSHRHCARSGRKRSRSSSWRHTGPPGLGSQSWCSLWQPLPGRFLWGRIYWLRDGAPYGTRVQTSGNFMSGRDAEVLGDLPQEVVDTITSARAPSTRHAYALKWNLFVEWCSSHREDPRRCPIRVVLSFLPQGFEQRLSPSTLKVYVAAITANHDPVEGKSLGKHDWVVRFLRGARKLNPPRPPPPPLYPLGTCP